ncbi:hypothetical protein SXCC_00977 [Gluconacetobacter sp. SXCC-1]|nr:hypothetical protein SXCC_00977 [Gluconacetobacter sp. SXCC-1]
MQNNALMKDDESFRMPLFSQRRHGLMLPDKSFTRNFSMMRGV